MERGLLVLAAHELGNILLIDNLRFRVLVQFAAVLNSKKAKIRELKSQLGDGRPLAIMPAADESDEGEATENEASGGEDDLEGEEEEERNQDGGIASGRSEEDRGERKEAVGMERDGGANGMDEDEKPFANGGGRDGQQAEEKGKGRGESIEESVERKDDVKPQVNVGSALLGGGSTYTSGPRKRRR